MCYHVKFGRSASKDVRINKRALESAPLLWERTDPLETHFFPICVTLPKLVVLGQTVFYIKKIALVCRLSRSLKVTRTDTDRPATHNFLLTFHSNR